MNPETKVCPICRNLLSEDCIECQATQNDTSPQECLIAWGKCQHVYHNHCINRWLEPKERRKCPLCNGEWEIEKLGREKSED